MTQKNKKDNLIIKTSQTLMKKKATEEFQNFQEIETIKRQPDGNLLPFNSKEYFRKSKVLIFNVGPNGEFIAQDISTCLAKEPMVQSPHRNLYLQTAVTSFKKGVEDAIHGNIEPIANLWDGIDAE